MRPPPAEVRTTAEGVVELAAVWLGKSESAPGDAKPEISTDLALATKVDFDPYRSQGIATLVDAWVPLTFAVNSVNRSMGQPDLYPFVLSPVIIDKLGYIDDLVHRRLQSSFADAAMETEGTRARSAAEEEKIHA